MRRTVSLPKAVDDTIHQLSEEGESYSATVARLVEAGAKAVKRRPRLAFIGMAKGDYPRDIGRNYELYLEEAFKAIGAKTRRRR